MFDWINAAACAVLLVLTFPIAVAMSHSGFWFQRILFAVVVAVLGLQAYGPLETDWLPPADWPQTLLNVSLMFIVLTGRKHIMTVIRATLGDEPADHPVRRKADFKPPRPLDESQMARARGAGHPT